MGLFGKRNSREGKHKSAGSKHAASTHVSSDVKSAHKHNAQSSSVTAHEASTTRAQSSVTPRARHKKAAIAWISIGIVMCLCIIIGKKLKPKRVRLRRTAPLFPSIDCVTFLKF